MERHVFKSASYYTEGLKKNKLTHCKGKTKQNKRKQCKSAEETNISPSPGIFVHICLPAAAFTLCQAAPGRFKVSTEPARQSN